MSVCSEVVISALFSFGMFPGWESKSCGDPKDDVFFYSAGECVFLLMNIPEF